MTEYDASEPRHIALQKRQAKAAERANESFIKVSMGTIDGRRYFHDLLVSCYVFANPFSADTHITAFNCGSLHVGQGILRDIMRWTPDQYILMMREANARDIADDARRARSDTDASADDEPTAYVHPSDDYNPLVRDAETSGNPEGE